MPVTGYASQFPPLDRNYRVGIAWREAALHGAELSTKQFAQELEKLKAHVPYPQAGFFGPGSMIWRVSRERALLFGGAWSGLLQLAHPAVAQGVADSGGIYSNFSERGINTLRAMYSLVFMDCDTAIKTAVRVHGMHTRVRGQLGESKGPHKAGTPYWAHDPELLRWVGATLIEGSALAYKTFVRDLSWAEEEALFADQQVVYGAFFGIPVAALWPDLKSFKNYMADMLNGETLQVSKIGRKVGWYFMAGPAEYRAGFPLQIVLAAGMLPNHIRRDFAIPGGPILDGAYAGLVKLVRSLLPNLPESMRLAPFAIKAEKALGISNISPMEKPLELLQALPRLLREQGAKAA